MYPILVAQHKLVMPVKNFFERKKSRQEIEILLKALQEERADLLAQNVELNAMISYNGEIKELLEFKKQFEKTDAVLAQVLVKHFSDQSHFFLIDKGAQAGMKRDMVAIFKNCLLGKIVEVNPHYSKVLLVTDSMCKVAAYCAHTQASGIHEGNNNEQLTGMRYVSHLAQVEPDDLVLSSGDGLVFPKGFALGKIKTCNPEGLFYDVVVEPIFDLRKIDYCFVIQKGAVLDSGALSAALITLCEDHEQQVEEQKKLEVARADHASSPIVVTGQLQEVSTVCQPLEDYIPAQQLVQQQRHAAQAEIEEQRIVL